MNRRSNLVTNPLCRHILLSCIIYINLNFTIAEPVFADRHSINFDFGPTETAAADFRPVGAHDLYSAESGYGLLEPAGREFRSSAKNIDSQHLIDDGILSEKEIKFRVDMPAGDYWIELFMPGGKFSIWSGRIIVNGKLVADSLHTLKTSFENESPPLYWTILKKVEVHDNYLILEIKTENQPAMLSAISVLPADVGLLELDSGKIRAVQNLQAPNAGFALHLINSGKIDEARRIIDPIPESLYKYEKALLLIALAGRLECTDPRPVLEWAAGLLTEISVESLAPSVDLHLRLIQLYLEADQWYKMAGWEWAKKLTGQSIFDRVDRAGFALQKITEVKDHPLYHQALFFLGKLTFWDWVEQHRPYMRQMADACFAELKPYYAENYLLQLYRGEHLADQTKTSPLPVDIPAWAYLESTALKGVLGLIHYWVDNRQAENGEFGGKYDDDVEMLRWWPVARLAVNDRTTLLGLQRLVDGIWHSDWIVNGFSAKVRDVEHAAEPVADTQPMMIGLDYGNPVYVERCMESIKGLDLWTGINARGHRHFKSSWYSSTGIDARPPRDCDLPMNARTVKAARWLAWYNRHPLAMRFLTEWADAWLEDCLRTDKGKPYGIVPSAIRYEDDAIGGHADNWHAPGMFWDYYNFHGGTQMLQQFLATYDLTGNERYLQPIILAIKLVAKYQNKELSDIEPGNEQWVVDILRHSGVFAELIEKYRLLTEDNAFDDLLITDGSEYLKFRLDNDLSHIEAGHRKILEGIAHNAQLITTEGYFTDRIQIGNIHKGQIWGTSHLESCYTGMAMSDGSYPFYAVSWEGFNENFSALVTNSTNDYLKILINNSDTKPQLGDLCFWRLNPGEYSIELAVDYDYDGEKDKILNTENIKIVKRGTTYRLQLPAKLTLIVTVRQIKPIDSSTEDALPDLALTKSELILSAAPGNKIKVQLLLHNIGTQAAKDFEVTLSRIGNGIINPLVSKKIGRLEAPLDLNSRIVKIEFFIEDLDSPENEFIIMADPADKVPEITEINNKIKFSAAEYIKIR